MILWLRFPWQKPRIWVQFFRVGRLAVYVPKTETRVGYMCSVDFDHELGQACDGNKVFPTIDTLKEQMECVNKGCGIYEVEIKFRKTVAEENLDAVDEEVFEKFM